MIDEYRAQVQDRKLNVPPVPAEIHLLGGDVAQRVQSYIEEEITPRSSVRRLAPVNPSFNAQAPR